MDDREVTPVARRALLVGAAGASAAWVAQLINASPVGARRHRTDRPTAEPLVDGDRLRVGLLVGGSVTTLVVAAGTRADVAVLRAQGATGVDGRASESSDDNAGVYGVGGAPAYGVLSAGRLGTSGALELRKQNSGVGTVPAKKVYLYFRELGDGSLGLVARFPNGVERPL